MDDTTNMLAMTGWANRRMGVLEGGDFCIVVCRAPMGAGYAAVLLGHVDDVGLEVARWERPHWAAALFAAVNALKAEPSRSSAW